MKIAVVGAGTAGTLTAWELAQDGHNVVVFERHSSCAEEASFAHPGWCSPAWPAAVAPDARPPTLQTAWPLTWAEARWWWRSRHTSRAGTRPSLALARYSLARLQALAHGLHLGLEPGPGALVLWRHAGDQPALDTLVADLGSAGLPYKLLDTTQAHALEPALHRATPLHQALHLPDELGLNARQLTLQVKAEAVRLGVVFEFNTVVRGLRPGTPPTLVWQADDAMASTESTFDAVVVCAGADSAHLLAQAGLRLPLARLWGRSISVPVQEAVDAPNGTVFDVQQGATVTRLGQWVRIAAGLRLGGQADTHREAGFQQLYRTLGDWFPGTLPRQKRGASTTPALEWTGAVAQSPNNRPHLGPCGLPGVWLNLGHGLHGCALACGSARVVADLVQGREPAVDVGA